MLLGAFLVALSPLALSSETAEDSHLSATTAFVNKYDYQIVVLGGLKFCQYEGLARGLLAELVRSATREHPRHEAEIMVHLVFAQSRGVQLGLELAGLNESQKSSVCQQMPDLADKAMKEAEALSDGP